MCYISPRANISKNVKLILGNNVTINDDVTIVGNGTLSIGDYTKIHRLSFIDVESDVKIGQNCWIGEKSVIDGTGSLEIGNNVGVGMLSTIYTHASFGDPLAGCVLRNTKKVKIEDDVWLMSHVSVASVNIAKRVVLMSGAVALTDICTQNTVWAGNPAIDCTDRYGIPWVERSYEWKLRRFRSLVKKYVNEFAFDANLIEENIKPCKMVTQLEKQESQKKQISFFCLTDHSYTKTNSTLEVHFMKWLLKHNKAKFVCC
jgi:acetyltransferase-like isoleucine patch superfamily enzyme